MSETIGQVIRRLRKEKDLTQEELAQLLNVSNQAVSKWECGDGMPDISQVVPLANVFGVTTDVLFGMSGTDGSEEAYRIVREAEALEEYGNTPTYLAAYDKMLEGLKKYPNNLILLNNCVGLGQALCLPENGWIYAPERADEIAAETERQAKRILMYSKNASDVMRAHQILVFLYSSRGEFDKAEAEADSFPVRADFTYFKHHSFVSEYMGNHRKTVEYLETDTNDIFVALADNLLRMGKAYAAQNLHREAIEVYECWFRLIRTICTDGQFPPFHDSDFGDCYLLLAEAYLALGDTDKAMENVENSVHYWLGTRSCTPSSSGRCSRILIDDWWYGCPDDVLKVKLTGKLESTALDPLRDCERFRALIGEVSSL
ncbi:MAG: helix-turn-helix transcriptional regulator [Clostridia bacterium]|nr:helix-turn-helix transcriptional regulator [Clostridia bacterium]